MDMHQGSANLNVMIKTARLAARSLTKDFREVESLQVSVKAAGDFVTKADISAEEIIRTELTEARPNYGWCGEESEEVAGADPTRRWIVDPLNGTANFLHGQPHWSISIALEHKAEIVAAVVFDAAKDEMFVAEKGAGAWMNNTRLRVSGRARMVEALLATGLPGGSRPYLPAALRDLGHMLPMTAGVRSLGSPALDLAWVAAGRFDGFWDRGLAPWDLAGGLLLVREAGGFVGPIHDGADILDKGQIIAANTKIFDHLTAELRVR